MTKISLIIKEGNSKKLENYDFKKYEKNDVTGKLFKNSEENTYIFSDKTNKNIYVDCTNKRKIVAFFDNNQPYFLYGTSNGNKGYYYPVYKNIPSNDTTVYDSYTFDEISNETFYILKDDSNLAKTSITTDLITDKGYVEYTVKSELIPFTIGFDDDNAFLQIQGSDVISTENGLSTNEKIFVEYYFSQTDKPFVKINKTEFDNKLIKSGIDSSKFTLDEFNYLLYNGRKLVQNDNSTDKISVKFISSNLPKALSSYLDNPTEGETIYGNISSWDTSLVTNMKNLFKDNTTFNYDISNWDLSNVTDTSYMFSGAVAFNQPIGNWNTSNVTNASYMFSGATVFNQPIGEWNVSNVTDMNEMFKEAVVFNKPIGNWNTSSVTNASYMFSGATVFNQDIGEWNVSNVTDMNEMFKEAVVFNKPIGNWNTSNVVNMNDMLRGATVFNQNIGEWNVSNVTNMRGMLRGATVFNKDIGNWNVSKVTLIHDMFHDAIVFNQPIGNWNTSNVVNMNEMFKEAVIFNQPIGNWNTSNVTNMRGMFQNSYNFNQPLNNWNISNVTNMKEMFDEAISFNHPLDNWNVSNVLNMKSMFKGDESNFNIGESRESKFNQDITNWNVSNVTDMIGMFRRNANFNQMIRHWFLNNSITTTDMFTDAASMNTRFTGTEGFKDTPTQEFFNYYRLTLLESKQYGSTVAGKPFGNTVLILTNSTSTINPTWYNASQIITTTEKLDWTYDGNKYIIRDSRLDSATNDEIYQITADYAFKNGFYVFSIFKNDNTIYIRENEGVKSNLIDVGLFDTVYFTNYENQVLGS